MSLTFEYCDARAKEASREAELATLKNVRERHLRSAKTWNQLAKQKMK